MRLLIRTDASALIGGGHLMRCLALAGAARARGHSVLFLLADTAAGFTRLITSAAFDHEILAHAPIGDDPDAPPHAPWLSAPWQQDAARTADLVAQFRPDWLIWDHYGLDARWVGAVRQADPALRVLAIDDLDDRPLGSDIVLDQTRLNTTPRRFPALSELRGPQFATLRPEFAALRASALDRRKGPVRHLLVTLGMVDGAGLLPAIFTALEDMPDLRIDFVTSGASQTLPQMRALCAGRADRVLHVDTDQMGALMMRADLCIGAGGMTSWERCCLGLPTLLVPVAPNQNGPARDLAQAGAVRLLRLDDLRAPERLRAALLDVLPHAQGMGQVAATLCDGQGSARVLDVLEAELRPVTMQDAQRLHAWRNTPRIRAASLSADSIKWNSHLAWLDGVMTRQDGLWWMYSEAGRALGHINARNLGEGVWHWGFYIGAPDAPKGAGGRMMLLAARRLLLRTDCRVIRADIIRDNARSLHLHRRLGFRQTGSREDGRVLEFSLRACDLNGALSGALPVMDGQPKSDGEMQ